MTDRETREFDPARHLTLISGNEYLEVKWRLVWLRSEHPDAHIDTELVHYGNNEAVCKAVVTIEGGGSATGWGSEDAQSFGDFIEKAETKALGRALAALGFGTQFCTDFDFGASQGRVVDSPVALRNTAPRGGSPPQSSGPVYNRGGGSGRTGDLPATDKQYGLIKSLTRDVKVDEISFDAMCRERTGKPASEFTRSDASAMIDHLKEMQRERDMGSENYN